MILGALVYQSVMEEVRAFEELIRSVEEAGANAKMGIERIGLDIQQTENINARINTSMLVSRGLGGLGAFLLIYSTYEELIKLKNRFV
ncbi:MAG: hypothetical protein MK229_02920 [Nitrososphaerales archaeon]|nr:hypothetical protein [Nitrososphaerales archaeon]